MCFSGTILASVVRELTITKIQLRDGDVDGGQMALEVVKSGGIIYWMYFGYILKVEGKEWERRGHVMCLFVCLFVMCLFVLGAF